jgi:hypothetical protein
VVAPPAHRAAERVLRLAVDDGVGDLVDGVLDVVAVDGAVDRHLAVGRRELVRAQLHRLDLLRLRLAVQHVVQHELELGVRAEQHRAFLGAHDDERLLDDLGDVDAAGWRDRGEHR